MKNKCNFTNIIIKHFENPEYARESYSWGFKYKGKGYQLSLTEPITDKRIVLLFQKMVKIMEGLLNKGNNLMETKEAIQLLNNHVKFLDKECDEFIRLLKRGEKYEEMWGWLDNSVNANGMYHNRKWKKEVGNIMYDIEQKYFPKK